MTRFSSMLLLLLGIRWCAMAQLSLPLDERAYTDSLDNILHHAPSDSTRARVCFQLAEYWRGKDTVKARSFLDQGARLAQRFPLPHALHAFYEGQFYFNTDAPKAADAFFRSQQQLAAFPTKEATRFRAMAWFNYGIMQRGAKGDDFVIDTWLTHAIPLAEQGGDEDKLALYYTQLGTLLMYNARFDKAQVYIDKGLTILEKHPGSPNLLFAYFAATSNAIYSKHIAAAKGYLDKAKALLAPYPESANYPNYYYNESLYYTAVNEFGKAMGSLDKGIAMARKLQQPQVLQMLVFRKYNILQESKAYGPARQLLLDILKEGTLTKEVNNRKTIYQQLASINASMGDMKQAYDWQVKYATLSDSLQEAKLQAHIQELEIKYNNAEKEKKIAQLEVVNAKAALAARKNKQLAGLFGMAAVLALVVALFATWFYRKNKQLAAAQLKTQVAQALLQGEENERARVARDLHDGLGGLLAGIKLHLSAVARPELHKVIDQLDHSSAELRRIAHNMMPEALLSYGLVAALQQLCASLETPALQVSFQPFGIQDNLPRMTQVTIYRIVQEALSNALRHAQASSVVVQCSQEGSTFFITVEDNGRGFDKHSISKEKGIGLSNIERRVLFLNGKMDIDAAVNEGTTINIELNVAG
ncbi:hypothetical protein DCC81_20325 [Chitinophaga parva]|uniref:Histidine kinase domain-containing protein n=2 Tax=Chitinophaga parva TaxID=2169414 RepID=A0A2T7BCE9_9BACT|nr:hypothetical protein DCC81_20325 [Chitinophaga parva]